MEFGLTEQQRDLVAAAREFSAAHSVVFARTGTAESRARGISAFLVPLDTPGLTRTAFDDHGGRSVGRGSLYFDGVRIPASHLLGDEGKGFAQVMHGHGAYATDMPSEQRPRDLLGLQIGAGTAQIMKLVIARQKARS